MKNNPIQRQSDGLRLWIELIRSSNQFERIIDKNLRQQYGQSISRFDVLSQLQRVVDQGLSVGELGQKLIVSKGNITGLVNRMIKDGLVIKSSMVEDRRYCLVIISSKGLKLFEKMADSHAKWISELFCTLEPNNMQEITSLLGKIRLSFSERLLNEPTNTN